MDRRKFMKKLSAAVGTTVLTNNLKIPVRSFALPKLSKIGLQLYTVRNQLERDFEGTLRKVSALGIDEVEFAGYFGTEPARIKRLLDELKITAPSAHVTTEFGSGQIAQAIESAKIIGHKYLVFAYLREDERRNLDDYKRICESLNNAGEECRKAGLKFAYHNHDFEFVRMDGQIPYDLILRETEKKLVRMELDLYWITKAGFDPVVYLEKHKGRFRMLHIKDMDRMPEKNFAEVGNGVIDFGRILPKALKAGIEHFFIEQDETSGDPFESVETSYRYLRKLEF
jgi:sugar phosphate isomerase/epimerase